MKIARAFVLHLYLLIEFFVSATILKLWYRDPIIQRHKLVSNTSRTAKKFLKAFNIDLSVFGREELENLKQQNHLIVANHVSYTDIIILSSIYPLVYITSVEMGENPFLGDITRLGGCLYTNRKKHTSLPAEIANFSQALINGFNVVLFPEGTSTDGSTIKEFRKSLFQIAILAKAPILPICIKYTHLDGMPIADKDRDTVCWYGDMTFVPHFNKLLGRSIKAEVHIMPAMPFSETNSRQAISDKLHSDLLSCYHSDR